MSSTGLKIFSETVQQSNLLLKDIEEKLGWEDRRNQSYLALRVVLQTLRDRLTVEEAAELSAQLPLLIKGVFYDGWKPDQLPKKMSKEEFIQEIRNGFFYSTENGIEEIINAVLKALQRNVSKGEAKDIKSIMPKDLAALVHPLAA